MGHARYCSPSTLILLVCAQRESKSHVEYLAGLEERLTEEADADSPQHRSHHRTLKGRRKALRSVTLAPLFMRLLVKLSFVLLRMLHIRAVIFSKMRSQSMCRIRNWIHSDVAGRRVSRAVAAELTWFEKVCKKVFPLQAVHRWTFHMTQSSRLRPGVAAPNLLEIVLGLRNVGEIGLLVEAQIEMPWLLPPTRRGDVSEAAASVSVEADRTKCSKGLRRRAKTRAKRRHWSTRRQPRVVIVKCLT